MVDVRYNHAQLGKAVSTLAVHPGRVKERLTAAANDLAIIDARIFAVKGMYEGAAGTWEKIYSTITAAPRDGDRGVFAPSIDRLTRVRPLRSHS